MCKKIKFILFLQILLAVKVFAEPRADMVVTFPVVSAFGYSFGANNTLSKFEGIEKSKPFTISSQVYGVIYDFPKVALSWALGMGVASIFDRVEESEKDFVSVGLTCGAGVFFNLWKSHTCYLLQEAPYSKETIEVLPLTGPCIFLYPVYDAKVYTRNATPYWKWKVAADFGLNYSYSFFDVFPFVRPIIAFRKNEVKAFCELGISLGIAVQ